MKCMYYLAPTLVSTHQVSDDLHEVGIDDWYIHVISKDEAGLKNEKIHSSNWFETTDLLRIGFIGANLGFIVGVLIAGGLLLFEPFGPNVPKIAYIFMVAVATGFGAVAGVEDTVLFKAGVLQASKVAWAGYRGLRRGKTLVVPGLRNKLTTFAVRFVPRSLLRKTVAMIQK